MTLPPFFAFLLALGAPGAAAAQTFGLPLDCKGCLVQNYADMDPGPQARDPACGPLTYEGHDGLDFRVTTAAAAAGAPVLAPADGVVRAVRDGQADGALGVVGRAGLRGVECGNGVVIDHQDGWSSQLCHMRNGSVRVAPGAKVSAGQPLGLIGLSGATEFPHVHLTLRRAGVVVEPLSGTPLAQAACAATPAPPGAHWAASARQTLTYKGAQWFVSGFAAPVAGVEPEAWPRAAAQGPALTFWSLIVGPRAGDILRVRLIGPDGAVIAETARTQTKDQAQAWLYAGKKTPAGGWAKGRYRGEAVLERGGKAVARRDDTMTF